MQRRHDSLTCLLSLQLPIGQILLHSCPRGPSDPFGYAKLALMRCEEFSGSTCDTSECFCRVGSTVMLAGGPSHLWTSWEKKIMSLIQSNTGEWGAQHSHPSSRPWMNLEFLSVCWQSPLAFGHRAKTAATETQALRVRLRDAGPRGVSEVKMEALAGSHKVGRRCVGGSRWGWGHWVPRL